MAGDSQGDHSSQDEWFCLPNFSIRIQVESSKNTRFHQGWDYVGFPQWWGRGVRESWVTAGVGI